VQPTGMTYVIENAWYVDFWKCRVSTTNSIDQGHAAAQADIDEEEGKRLSEVAARLKNLLNDKEFARLPTQKAMLAYAKRKIAGIDEIDSETLREAISDLKAEIVAKGSE
jgi:hypothetical protein